MMNKLIKTLCDGDLNHQIRNYVKIHEVNYFYNYQFNEDKARYFKKYARECELATQRMNEN